MRYYRVENGVVVEVRTSEHTDCPNSTNELVECGWLYADGMLDGSPVTAAAAQAAAIASIYAPVAYNGKLYPVDTESMAKYEMAKQSRTRGKMAKGIAIATDGTVLKLTGTAAIDAFHAAMEDAVIARVAAIHDAI